MPSREEIIENYLVVQSRLFTVNGNCGHAAITIFDHMLPRSL